MSDLDFACPKCGKKIFKSAAKPKVGLQNNTFICVGCGHKLTELEVQEQARQFMRAQVNKMFRK